MVAVLTAAMRYPAAPGYYDLAMVSKVGPTSGGTYSTTTTYSVVHVITP